MQRDDAHQPQGVVRGGGIGDGQVEGRVQRGRQHDRERGAEDRGAAEEQEGAQGQERAAFSAGAGEVPRQDGGDDGGGDRQHGPQLAAEQLQADRPARDRQQQYGQEPDEPLAGAVPDVAVGLQCQERQAVQQREADDGEAAQHGVGAEPRERTAFAVAVGVDRQSGGGQPQCGADAEGRHEGAEGDGPVPAGPPAGVVHLAAVFEGHGAEDEGDEDQQQRQVERGEQ